MKHKTWHKIRYRFMSVYVGLLAVYGFAVTFPEFLPSIVAWCFFPGPILADTWAVIWAIVHPFIEYPVSTLAVNIPMMLALGYAAIVIVTGKQ